MSSCAVINCTNVFMKSSENVSFHRFPADEASRKEWLLRCGRTVDANFSELLICSVHFSDDDFESATPSGISAKSPRLRSNAIPHLNLLKIKQEPPDADDIEIVDCRPLTTTSRLDVPSIFSIATSSKVNLGNEDFESRTICESASCDIASVPFVLLESSSTAMNIKEDPASLNSNYIPSSLPASQNWAGEYNFTVSFGPQEKNTKGVSWTYSKVKDKLYVGKDVPCPINFSANMLMSDDVVIRALALYSSPEHTSEIVQRCVNHSLDELKQGIFEAEHLVRCESSMATYDINETTKRHSVIVPFENPPAGQHYSTYIYKFACFGSCAGGPNRRPLMLIFSLEKGGRVVGRRKIDVKICACPGRDRKAEEKLFVGQDGPVSIKRKESELMSLSSALDFTQSVLFPPPKKSKVSPNEEGLYSLTVRDKKCYDFLKQMKKLYEICKTMKSLPPEVKKSLIVLSRRKNSDQDV